MKTKRQRVLQAYLAFLNQHPVFTLDDLTAVAGGKEPRQTARERVKYYVETGRLRRLARELYAVVPQGTKRELFQPDPFLVASALRDDAVFSHHSALELLGAGHSDWNVCTAFTGGRPASLRWGTYTLRLLRAPVHTLGEAWTSLGVREVAYRGFALRTTGPERTLIEGFRQPQWVGGLAELVESAGGFASLNPKLLRKVLEAYDQRSLWAAAGWFLERHAREFHVGEAELESFAKHRPKSKHYLPRGMRGGAFVARWNLMLPPELVRKGRGHEPLT
jgi:predicted transcriptional regulator of viral defense system